MRDWLTGTALVLVIPVTTALCWFVLGWAMGPNVISAVISPISGGLAFRWLLKCLNKRAWDKALRW